MNGKNNRNIAFQDLKKLHKRYKSEIEMSIRRVLDSGWFILGKEVEGFEREFSFYNGVRYTVTVGSGTEALKLSLESLGISKGDEVITVSNTFIATALSISAVGATPVFVDINEDDCNIDPDEIEKAITKKTKAIIVVHLNGYTAEMDNIMAISRRYKIHIIEDACQAHGSEYHGRKAGTFGDLGCFSFYPTKNLGAYGDGGAIVTNNKILAEKIRLLRNYGQTSKYHHKIKGHNSRLDEIQAAILRVKLKYLDEMNQRRRVLAELYFENLKNLPISLPPRNNSANPRRHNYYLFPIAIDRRDGMQKFLKKNGVDTQIHFPVPIHLQQAYKEIRVRKNSLSITKHMCEKILSLPMHSELTKEEVEYVSDSIKRFFLRE